MKLRYIKRFLALSAVLSIAAVSCLKDDAFDDGSIQSVHSTDGVPKVIEIKLTATNTSNFFTLAVTASDNDTIVNLVPINLASAGAASEDIHVTVVLDSNVVNDYNAANTDTTVTIDNPNPTGVVTHYVIPTAYTIVNPIVTIPKGSHTGYLQIKLNPSDFIGGGDQALGFRIESVQEPGYTVSGNFNTGITAIAVKNVYDGEYSVTGTLTDTYIPDYTGNYPEEVYLITSGATEDTWYDVNYGYFHEIAPGGSVYGGVCPIFTFDADGNVIEVHNYYAVDDPANPNMRTLRLDPTGINKYDFTTRTLRVKYIMYQGTLGIDRSFFDETFSYVGPR